MERRKIKGGRGKVKKQCWNMNGRGALKEEERRAKKGRKGKVEEKIQKREGGRG